MPSDPRAHGTSFPAVATWPRTVLTALVPLALAGALSLAGGLPTDGAAPPSHDVVVEGGRVMDPASGLDAVRNVGIRDGRIVAVTAEPLDGERVIDASGLVVAPGFVDLHEHGATPEAYRLMVRDGVTTALELEVGTDDVEAWYRERADGRLVNHGVSVGHIPVRMAVMDDPGEFLPSGSAAHDRATESELDEIEARIRRGLGQGAVAVGFGTAYTPGAPMSEVTRMFRAASDSGASVHVHLRSGVAGLDSTLSAAGEADVPLHVVHVNSTGGDSLQAFLREIREAREAGRDVTTETYPYGAGMTRIESALFDDWESWPDSAFRRYQWVATGERLTRERFAEARREGGAVIIHSRTEDQTRTAVTSPLTMIASDGFVEDGQAHPRIAGTYSKVLGRYVREEGALTLMEALRKMTVRPARRLEARVPAMARKGRIAEGADADLTLFDAATVRDRATYTEPLRPPQGIPYVIVAGVPVVEDGELVDGVRPGRAVRAPTGDGARSSADLPLADSLARWYALGMGAHHLCAGLWVVGRDHERSPEEVVARDIAPFPSFRWRDSHRYEVDRQEREATVSSPGVGSRTAEYNGDQGCTILPAGAEDVHFEPVEVASELPPAPEQDWPTGDRDARGTYPDVDVDREALEATLDWAFDDSRLDPDQNTRGVVVLYRGKILAERYAPGWGPRTPQISWSMGKSIASALTGVMVERGYYGLDDPAPVEAWRGPEDPRREIRIRDLLRMSSGLDFDNFGLGPEESYTTANEHMRIYFDALNVRRHAVHQPLRFEPGSTWRYRNSDPLSLMHVAREALAREGRSWLRFPREALFDRIGMRSAVLETDAWGNFILTGFDYASTRDWARFGLLHLNDGLWEGERILPEGWTEFVSTPAPGDPSEGYGGLFWLNRSGALDRVPRDAYWAAGYMGQLALVIPSREMVVVRQGPSAGGYMEYFDRLVGEILEAVGRPAGSGAP